MTRDPRSSASLRLALIETERLELQPLHVAHAEEMAAVLADPGLYTFISGGPPSVSQLRARYRRQVVGGSADGSQRWLNYVVRKLPSRVAVGYVQATVEAETAELAWVIGTPWQGRGYATEAAHALVALLQGQGVRRLLAHVHPDHRASEAVARHLGLRPTDHWHARERRWTTPPGPGPRTTSPGLPGAVGHALR